VDACPGGCDTYVRISSEPGPATKRFRCNVAGIAQSTGPVPGETVRRRPCVEMDQRPMNDDPSALSGLRHSSDERPGIVRHRAGRGFTYRDPDGRTIRDPETLTRIRSIAIPPAWTDVWI